MYEVEVANKYNDRWLCPANQSLLRGRWDYQNCMHLDVGERHKLIYKEVQIIPGICIAIDPKAQTITIHDPLRTTDSGREIWAKIKAMAQFFADGGEFQPWETQVIDLKKDRDGESTFKTWMYWMARGIESGHAVPTKESERWPTSNKIEELPGLRIVYPYDETKTLTERLGAPSPVQSA